ncbi:programmed cell death 6-interacting protein-like [Sitodiplosis mosellana]|uniref:programmed cell death 6-interacting protein-like n=1 Tax=Sitodiplosis mosellana TaxID=263140 RepID=UPI002443F221|nr:programmed cell death 6-interacting protein-like [Sitodiplosis mosellana]
MAALLVVPLKKTFEVDIAKPLKNLINRSYNGNNANVIDHSEAVNELSKLRNTALVRPCITIDSLETIYNYYDQLLVLESKIPMHELQNVPFKWKNAFDKKMFKGRISLTLPSLAYEKQCVLFNIAAMQCAIAAAQGTYRDDGFRLAIKLLQQSAGIFAHLTSVTSFSNLSTCDLDTDTLQVLSNLMLAQAQEIFVLKAIKHSMKESTVAELASSCQHLYERVLRGLQKDSLRSIWDKDWINTVAGKQCGFEAIAQFYQSLVCRNRKAIGEEIARLQYSTERFEAAKLHSGKPNLYEEFLFQAQQNLNESKKDNDFIYNATVPNMKTLVEPKQHQLAKVLPFTTPLSPNSRDFFVHLVPIVLHRAIDVRKSEIISGEMMKLRESTQKLNETLVRLNLPATIEVAVGSTLPRSILNKAKDVREMGGIDGLCKLIDELPESLRCNEEVLDEVVRMLNEEADADTRIRTQFMEKWSQKPSEKLTKTIRSNIAKYREIIHNAVMADKAIRKTFEKHAHVLKMLSKPISQLENECSIGFGDGNISNSRSAQELRRLMDNVDALKAEREQIESELKSATVDLKDQFLNALAEDGAINESDISDVSIRKIFAPLCKRVNENVLKQQVLIEKTQSVYHDFERECSDRSEARDAFLNGLASAYDTFITLRKHLKEGTKFYSDLTYLLITFRQKVSDFCNARKTEKFDLIKSIIEDKNSNWTMKTDNQNETITIQAELYSHITMAESFNPYATFTIRKIQ